MERHFCASAGPLDRNKNATFLSARGKISARRKSHLLGGLIFIIFMEKFQPRFD